MEIDYEAFRALHRTALDDTTALVAEVTESDLGRPTPCADWDVRALLGHLIGQNVGFATAVETGDADENTYAAPAFTADTVSDAWQRSATRLAEAFAAADTRDDAHPVRLAEVSADNPLPVGVVLAMQLLDTAVHAWDLATALQRPYRPSDDTVAAVAQIAQLVPVGPQRDVNASFAQPVSAPDDDPWHAALAHLGRIHTAL